MLAAHFHDMDALAAADTQRLLELPDVGPEVASSIRSFFESPANQHMLAGLREAGLWPVAAAEPAEAAGEGGPLQGKNILFTGTLSMARGKAKQLAEAAGAVVLGEVPPNATAVGVPAQVVRVAGKPVYYADDVDQTSVENPTLERIEALSQRLEFLEKMMDQKYLEERAQTEA